MWEPGPSRDDEPVEFPDTPAVWKLVLRLLLAVAACLTPLELRWEPEVPSPEADAPLFLYFMCSMKPVACRFDGSIPLAPLLFSFEEA